MKTKLVLAIFTLVLVFSSVNLNAQEEKPVDSSDKLVVIWSSGDPDVAEKVCFMYTHAAKKYGWFKDVTLIVWGPSAKLATENSKIQEKLKAMQEDGVVLEACIACARSYGVDEKLKEFGIDVKGMGTPLTAYLKSGAKVITF